MSLICSKYNFEVFACSTFLHTPPPEFTWIAVKFCDSRHFYPYPWIHVHCNAFWWILVTYRTSTPPPEFTCIAMHFTEFLRLNALLPLPLNSCAMQCILVNFCDLSHFYPSPWIHVHCNAFWWIFTTQHTSTPHPEFTCIAMHFSELFDPTYNYVYPRIHVHCNAFWCRIVHHHIYLFHFWDENIKTRNLSKDFKIDPQKYVYQGSPV